jgi:cytochrome c oxidase subunit 1
MAEEIPAPGGDLPVDHTASDDNYLTHGKGILSWLFTLDHKRIGVMYLVATSSSRRARRS